MERLGPEIQEYRARNAGISAVGAGGTFAAMLLHCQCLGPMGPRRSRYEHTHHWQKAWGSLHTWVWPLKTD